MNPSLKLRVNSVRCVNSGGRGGAIFTGVEIDDLWRRTDAKTYYVVLVPSCLLSVSVERGQVWSVRGKLRQNTIVVNGYNMVETTIDAQKMELLRPSGEHIVTMLAEGEPFIGVGQVKARRLWEHFGEGLYKILDEGDDQRLYEVLTPEVAKQLGAAWRLWGDGFTLQWLQSKGLPIGLGRKVLNYFGRKTSEKIEEDPYRLLSFAFSWEVVDKLARETFGVMLGDQRRLTGGVEETLHAAFDGGHTCLEQSEFNSRVGKILGHLDGVLLQSAIRIGKERGSIIVNYGRIHAIGPYIMETTVAEAIAQRMKYLSPLLSNAELKSLIDAYEAEERLRRRDHSFSLNTEQCKALITANNRSFCVITGGAGTGKTTVLRVLFRMYGIAGYEVFGMALSGKATKRIREATGYKAQTIASFLRSFSIEHVPDLTAVVIDEASMVDLLSIYRVVCLLSPRCRIVLVGDPHQLPPVGPGLLLHELVLGDGVPLVELKEVRRHGGEIARTAALIREGRWPELPTDADADVSYLPCNTDRINDVVLSVYAEGRFASQILCATRNSAVGGTKLMNTLCQKRFNADGANVLIYDPQNDQVFTTGFRVGDPVICVRNFWDLDLQNGSLGMIKLAAFPTRNDDPARVLGQILWDDGKKRDLTFELLANIELAYAITIHKSQGSAFPRVVIPVSRSRLLDRTLLYTAVTRAESKVVLVGDEDAIEEAVKAPRKSEGRQVALRAILRRRMEFNEMA